MARKKSPRTSNITLKVTEEEDDEFSALAEALQTLGWSPRLTASRGITSGRSALLWEAIRLGMPRLLVEALTRDSEGIDRNDLFIRRDMEMELELRLKKFILTEADGPPRHSPLSIDEYMAEEGLSKSEAIQKICIEYGNGQIWSSLMSYADEFTFKPKAHRSKGRFVVTFIEE